MNQDDLPSFEDFSFKEKLTLMKMFPNKPKFSKVYTSTSVMNGSKRIGALMISFFWKLLGVKVCRVTKLPHDYFEDRGGDGHPSHFYEYTCSKCSEKFGI